MAKPFSIQSPENIAKEYAGNKQMIAQAMQMGVVDPTAGVLAGMFIDRMRSAQMQEQAPQTSVAQQVMGGAPPVPAPPLPAGGLGSTAPAGAPPVTPEMGMPPEMGMAPPMPEGAPMGMAEGGLAMLPVPDTMFDEPTNGGFNDGYAGGGIVAFSDGGMADLYDRVEQVESGGRQSAVSPKGARGVMQLMPGTMRDPGFGVRPMQADTEEENRRVGREYLDAMYSRYGDETAALAAYNWGPGNVDKWLKSGADPKKLPKETRDYIGKVTGDKGASSGAPRRTSNDIPDILAGAERFRESLTQNITPKTQRREEMIAELEGAVDPETRAADRKARRYEALAQFGFQLAQTPGSLLQAAGAAASQVLPTLRKGDEEARKQLRADQSALISLEDKSNEEKQKIELLALELAKAEAGLLSDERKMELQYIIAQMDDKTRRAITAMNNYTQTYTSVHSDVMRYRTAMDKPDSTSGTKPENTRERVNAILENQGGSGFKYLGTE